MPTFHVGHIPVHGELILSPMTGISDLPFRSLCRELGSAMSYTEFVNSADVITRFETISKKFSFDTHERPVVFQLYGEDADQILKAAHITRELNPDIIDINMGCPAKTISNRGAGVGLMRTPLKVARIFRKLTHTLDIPITAKIRLGWDDDCRKYALIARIIEENGGALVAIHGRTRKQNYNIQANWDAIAEVKQSISIPVIGNGDVHTVADIERMKTHTACDGVMIGRAAIGNPWIFSRLDREQVSHNMVRTLMLDHLERNLAFYGPEHGLILFRKHASKYLSPYRLPRELRYQLLTREQPEEFLELLDSIDLGRNPKNMAVAPA